MTTPFVPSGPEIVAKKVALRVVEWPIATECMIAQVEAFMLGVSGDSDSALALATIPWHPSRQIPGSFTEIPEPRSPRRRIGLQSGQADQGEVKRGGLPFVEPELRSESHGE